MRGVWLRRVGFSLCLALALGYLPYRVYRKSGLHRYLERRDELARIIERNRQLRREAVRLRAELEAFADGQHGGARAGDALPLAVVERVARDELGLVRPGEVVFQLNPERGP